MGGKIRVHFPAQGNGETLEIRLRAPSEKSMPPTLLSGMPFEITARSKDRQTELRSFEQPLTIQVEYDEASLWGPEGGLKLFYYDEAEGEWKVLPSWVDEENNLLIAQTNHLTVFDYNIETWQTPNLPKLDSAQVSQFTGAGTYSLNFWTPPGSGGLQPSLSVEYNSQVVDNAMLHTQASWVGMGWSLETGYIERNMYGTPNYLDDDTFSLEVNGVSNPMLLGSDGTYHTTDESYWRIQYDATNNLWIVWDKTGTQYTFGHQANYPGVYTTPDRCYKDITWRWSLTKVKNIFGKELTYDYTTETKQVRFLCGDSTRTESGDMAVYPSTITYPNNRYRIRFVRGNRTDYKTDWTSLDSMVFFRRSQLSQMLVEHASSTPGVFDQVVRKYVFNYYTNESTPIFPNYTWSAGGKTLTLWKVQEFGLNEDSLPPTTFTYSDYQHLTRMDNGFGGAVEFVYERWNDLNSPEERVLKATFGYGASPPCTQKGGWHATNSRYEDQVWCVSNKLHFTTEIYRELPQYYFRPGGVYKVRAIIEPRIGGATVRGGLRWSGGSAWSDWVSLPITLTNDISPEVTIPITTTASEADMLLSSVGSKMTEYQLHLVPLRYRVVEKKIYDGSTPTPQIYNFRYDEAATNDKPHSSDASTSLPYYDPYSQFRGHAMIQEIGPLGSDGQRRVTTTWFYQDDLRNGRISNSLTGTQSFFDGFEALNSSDWSSNPGSGSLVVSRYLGDKALLSTNPAMNWNTNFTRSSYTLKDTPNYSNSVIVQFQVSSDTAQAVLGLEADDPTYRRWGIYIHDMTIQAQYNDGGGYVQQTILNNFKKNTWYVLHLTVDDQKFYMRVWERDDSAKVGRYEYPMAAGKLWRFKQWSYNGTVYLDSYSEGKAYTLVQERYTSDAISTGALPKKSSTQTYTGLGINWTRLTDQVSFDFNGDGEWNGRRNGYEYNSGEQGGEQYGNLTRLVEEEWDRSQNAWKDFRLTVHNYHSPKTDGGVYLVGIVGMTTRYKCPAGTINFACSTNYPNPSYPPMELMLDSHWYLYDGSTSWSSQPTTGVLSGERTFLRFQYPDTYSGLHYYQDAAYGYDAWGNQTITIIYNAEGTNETNGFGKGIPLTTTTAFDPNYHTYPILSSNPLTQTTSWTYNYILGLPISETDPNDAVTTAAYDNLGRLIKVVRPADSDTTPTILISYDDDGYPFWTEAQQRVEGNTYYKVRKFYNGLGQLIQSQTAGANVDNLTQDILVDIWYDGYGNVVRESVPYSVTANSILNGNRSLTISASQTTYDILGRRRIITAPDNSTQVFTYTTSSTDYPILGETQQKDARGNISRTFMDVWGRTQLVIPPTGPTVDYEYDQLDQLTTVSRGGANTTLSYDNAGRKIGMSDPDMGIWSYAYDALGNLVSQTDARACTMTLTYDVLNRVTSKFSVGVGCGTHVNISISYDQGTNGIGRRTGMTDAGGSTSWNYDQRGRVVTETRTIDSGIFITGWEYNSANMVKMMKYPDGETVNYTYHPQVALDSVVGMDTYVRTTVYDAAGRVELRELGLSSGQAVVKTDYGYYPWTQQGGRLQFLKSGTPNDPVSLQSLEYNYDMAGNLNWIKDYKAGGTQTQTFSYDTLDHLTSASASGGTGGLYSESYSYDSVTGNLSFKSGIGTYTYDTTHKHAVAATSNGWSFGYDANGNMTQRVVNGQTYTLSYDAEGHLVSVTGPSMSATFTYDGDGKRVKSVINGVRTYYVGNYYEVLGSIITKYYYAGAQRVAVRVNGTISYILTDHLGSTSVIADAGGAWAGEQRYKAWGEVRYASGTMPTKYTYTGQYSYTEGFGLMFYNARWYDPSLGRFAQGDTIVPEGVQGWDRYAYVYNNPLRYVDANGHDVGCAGYDAIICGKGDSRGAMLARTYEGVMKERTKNGFDPNPEVTHSILHKLLGIYLHVSENTTIIRSSDSENVIYAGEFINGFCVGGGGEKQYLIWGIFAEGESDGRYYPYVASVDVNYRASYDIGYYENGVLITVNQQYSFSRNPLTDGTGAAILVIETQRGWKWFDLGTLDTGVSQSSLWYYENSNLTKIFISLELVLTDMIYGGNSYTYNLPIP
jgi:RHS repeat-associated protein